eukprot:8218687-Pyramimonas_sp.AAC.1
MSQDGEPELEVPGLWRQFLRTCQSPTDDAKREMDVWAGLEKVVPFLRGEVYVKGDETRFRDAINEFTEKYVACWGEGHVTHYMHILYAHAPWFMKEYGSLGVWQCQGMEKSHWVARGNYQKHTNHDGGRQPLGELTKSSLYQLLQFDYRQLMHRRKQRAVEAARVEIEEKKMAQKKKAQGVFARWWLAATQQAKAAVGVRAKKARAHRVAMLNAQREQFEQIKQEVLKCHGVVSSYEESSCD